MLNYNILCLLIKKITERNHILSDLGGKVKKRLLPTRKLGKRQLAACCMPYPCLLYRLFR